jgi:hypothetical protein
LKNTASIWRAYESQRLKFFSIDLLSSHVSTLTVWLFPVEGCTNGRVERGKEKGSIGWSVFFSVIVCQIGSMYVIVDTLKDSIYIVVATSNISKSMLN